MRAKKILAAAALAACAFVPAALAADAGGLRQELLNGGNSPTTVTEKTFFVSAEYYLMGIVAALAIGTFIWIGYNMLTAEGDPEKFKQAQKALIYAVIGLALIPLAYVMVKLVITINL